MRPVVDLRMPYGNLHTDAVLLLVSFEPENFNLILKLVS